MFVPYEGEIILKERYGSVDKERFYIKPPEQRSIVTLEEEKQNNVANWFARIFLPQGYPDSVSSDYIAYQIWDTAQAFCSTITGTLATKEVLSGVGVGDNATTPLAATITWVIKEACGHLGRITFAFTHGTHLDAYSKRWRLYADFLNDIAMCLELALPLFKDNTTIILCTSTVLKAIVGVAGGATRAALTQHHAIRGNLADVAAKDAAQETAVNLVASITALLLLSFCGYSKLIFFVMVILHIYFNYLAVRAVCLKTLNEPRFLQLIQMYLRENVVSNPHYINHQEIIFSYQMGSYKLDKKICGYEIKLGHSIKNIVKEKPAMYMKSIKDVYEQRNYMLVPDVPNNVMYVLIREAASSVDVLHAYYNAVLLSIATSYVNNEPLAICDFDGNESPFARMCASLKSVEWSREESEYEGPHGRVTYYDPSPDMMTFVEKFVRKDWSKLKQGIARTGWNLKKHLLVVDEWRIAGSRLSVVRPPVDDSDESDNNYKFKYDVGTRISSTANILREKLPQEGAGRDVYTIEPEMTVGPNSTGKLQGIQRNADSMANQTPRAGSSKENVSKS